jgi:hypothetical protein
MPQGLIVRLPKLVDDPAPEPVWVPETVTLTDFLEGGQKRRASGRTLKTTPAS